MLPERESDAVPVESDLPIAHHRSVATFLASVHHVQDQARQ
jgi:hypothetical protein